jgi:hypothetical protein
LVPHSARINGDWTLSHAPHPVHPDRSVTQRDYRGWPALDNRQLSSSMSASSRKKSSGNWMISCYDDLGRTIERVPNELIYRDDYKRMPVYPWHY